MIGLVMKSVRATSSLGRRDLLTEKERLRLLGTLDRWLATGATRPRSEALTEIEELREARRAAGQSRP